MSSSGRAGVRGSVSLPPGVSGCGTSNSAAQYKFKSDIPAPEIGALGWGGHGRLLGEEETGFGINRPAARLRRNSPGQPLLRKDGGAISSVEELGELACGLEVLSYVMH